MNVTEFSSWVKGHDWLFIREVPSYHRVAGNESRIELWLSPEGRTLCVNYTNGKLTTVAEEK